MIEVKKKAHLLQKRAKELGYDLKLTHAQELVSIIHGHKTRHSALLEDKKNNDSEKPKDKFLVYMKQLAEKNYVSVEDFLIKKIHYIAKHYERIEDYIDIEIKEFAGYFMLERQNEIYEYLRKIENSGCRMTYSDRGSKYIKIYFGGHGTYTKLEVWKSATEIIEIFDVFFNGKKDYKPENSAPPLDVKKEIKTVEELLKNN